MQKVYFNICLGVLARLRQLPLLVDYGLIDWIPEMARIYFLIQALGLTINPVVVPVVALVHPILRVVPLPGGLGLVEPGITGLLLLNLQRHDAVTLSDCAITCASVIFVGGLVFFA